jgi:hypothetical protein
MLQLSDFKQSIMSRAISLGFNPSTPSVNVDFWLTAADVNEDGTKTAQKRRVFYGTSTPSDKSYTTIWMRSDNGKMYHYDFSGALIEETHITELFETNF